MGATSLLFAFLACAHAFLDHNLHVHRALASNDEAGLILALESRAQAMARALDTGDLASALALARGAPRERRALSPAARALFSDEWVSVTAEEVTTLRGTAVPGLEPPHCA